MLTFDWLCFVYMLSEFPKDCLYYYANNTIACYKSIWHKVGCIDEGYKFPGNLTKSDVKELGHLSLMYEV